MSVLAATAATAATPGGNIGPHRRAGLWEQSLTIDDGRYQIPPSQMCIDAAADKNLTLVGSQMDRRLCSAYAVEKGADGGWTIQSVCTLDPKTTVTTKGSARGDFDTAYSVVATGVASGPTGGVHKVAITARWIGPCPPGQVGGDVTTGGKTRNVLKSGD